MSASAGHVELRGQRPGTADAPLRARLARLRRERRAHDQRHDAGDRFTRSENAVPGVGPPAGRAVAGFMRRSRDRVVRVRAAGLEVRDGER